MQHGNDGRSDHAQEEQRTYGTEDPDGSFLVGHGHERENHAQECKDGNRCNVRDLPCHVAPELKVECGEEAATNETTDGTEITLVAHVPRLLRVTIERVIECGR